MILTTTRDSKEFGISMFATSNTHLYGLVMQIKQLKARTGAQRLAEFILDFCLVEKVSWPTRQP